MKKRIIAMLLASAMVVTLFAGCGGGGTDNSSASDDAEVSAEADDGAEVEDAEAPEEEEQETEEARSITDAEDSESVSEVHVGIGTDPAELSPFSSLSDGRNSVDKTLYEYLITRDGFGGDMVGILMKDYEMVDETTCNVTIYDYIYDTAGNHLTAEDVAFSYMTAKELGNLPKLAVLEVEAVDEYVAQFRFDDLLAGDLETLLMECPVVTQAAYEASADGMATDPVGTSAYEVEEFIPGSSLTFVKTDNYWQTEEELIPADRKANVEKVVFEVITEASQMAIALETGTIDISTRVTDNDIDKFNEGGEYSDRFDVYRLQDNKTQFLMFNLEDGSIFDGNLELRQAIAYAIDSQGLVDGAYGGDALAVKTYGNAKYSDYNEAWDSEDYYDYDVEKAKELLASAGYGEGDLSLKLLVESQDSFVKMAEIMQAYLMQIGIDVEILAYEANMYNTMIYDASEWDILLKQGGSTDYIVNVWKLDMDATQFENGTINFVKDEELQDLLNLARTTDGHVQENVDAVHYHIKDNAYVIGLTQFYSNIVHANGITSIMTDARGYVIPGACVYSSDF